jgi:hypothetical protein
MRIVNLLMIGGIAEIATSVIVVSAVRIVDIRIESLIAKTCSIEFFYLNANGVSMLSILKNALGVSTVCI